MNKINSIPIILIILFTLRLQAQTIITDIYTIQQDPALQGKEVAVVGIVTASTGIFNTQQTFIGDAAGGPWSGIALWDASASIYVEEGDRIRVIGIVSENAGLTQISVGSFYKFSSGNPLPNPEAVASGDVGADVPAAEAYESVLVEISNVTVINDSLGDGEWLVDDGSGPCRIGSDADNFLYSVPEVGTEITSITGILSFKGGNYVVEPRYRADIVDGDTSYIYTIPEVKQNTALIGDTVTVEGIVTVETGVLHHHETYIEESAGGIFSGILLYDSTDVFSAEAGDALRVTGIVYEADGMMGLQIIEQILLSKGNQLPEAEIVSTGDIAAKASHSELYEGVLVQVNDIYVSEDQLGNGEWEANSIEGACDGLREFCIIGNKAPGLVYEVPVEGTPLASITGVVVHQSGQYKLEPRYETDIKELPLIGIGDTLTIIQQPLLNIPAIIQPGDTLLIECNLSENPYPWSAALISEDYEKDLTAVDQVYDTDKQLWMLKAIIPANLTYKLYDLKVEISGGEVDISENAVKIIQNFKEDFYFIHITDTHLPTHYFCRDEEFGPDSSEINDIKEVMKDIDLINPEFVIHTGDLVNEGELEDYLNLRSYTRAKKLLTKLNVPLYMVPGNHDLGGWDATPMSDGTARRNWWRFFGWKSLDSETGMNRHYTQDYSFRYGPCQFIGMEAYLNYDYWRSEIYGGESFIESQLDWLDSKLNSIDNSLLKILFFHYDFNNSLALESRGIDLALWGHSHSDSGSLDAPPFYLGTEACSDGRRAYRLIRVKGGEIMPSPTLRAGENGDNLELMFTPANDGLNYKVTAQITNNFTERFEHALLRFVMPRDGSNPQITNGEIVQIDTSGQYAIYHVGVDLKPNASQTVALSCYSAGSGPFAEECYTDKKFYVPGKDTVNIKTIIVNPEERGIIVKSIIESIDKSVRDTLAMHDDGNHGDNQAGDGVYVGYWPAGSEEKDFTIHISTMTQDSLSENLLSDGAYFTTIGPVLFDSVYIAQQIGTRSRVRLLLQNAGKTAAALGITAELKINDPQISIEDNLRPFDDILPGLTVASKSFYSIIASNPPDSVQVVVDIFSNGRFFWTDSFTLDYTVLNLSETGYSGPLVYELSQNYPNPFNPVTTIEFTLPKTEHVNLIIHDSVGKEVALLINNQMSAGRFKYVWDASDFASGVYYYTIEVGNFRQSKKLILLK